MATRSTSQSLASDINSDKSASYDWTSNRDREQLALIQKARIDTFDAIFKGKEGLNPNPTPLTRNNDGSIKYYPSEKQRFEEEMKKLAEKTGVKLKSNDKDLKLAVNAYFDNVASGRFGTYLEEGAGGNGYNLGFFRAERTGKNKFEIVRYGSPINYSEDPEDFLKHDGFYVREIKDGDVSWTKDYAKAEQIALLMNTFLKDSTR